jgi:hypothetical protein
MFVLPLLGLGGCTAAVFDAAAAGGLSFIQSSVITLLSDAVFPGSDASATESSMTDMTDMADMDGHGG